MKKMYLKPYSDEDIDTNPQLRTRIEKTEKTLKLAMQVYSLRKEKGWTQKELAKKAGIKQSNISRLENADYEGGHSLKTLEKVAKALDLNLDILFIQTDKMEENRKTHTLTGYIDFSKDLIRIFIGSNKFPNQISKTTAKTSTEYTTYDYQFPNI
jgi:HTH-type transcriptional regulator / antitoxin HipB